MSGTRGLILVLHPDRKSQRTIHRILGATLYTIDVVDSLAQAQKLLTHRVPELIVLDHRVLAEPDGELLVEEAGRRGTTACLVLVSEAGEDELPGIFATGAMTNLLANPMPLLAEELTATALKLLRGDIFGLEKYLSWGIEARTIELTDAADRSAAVDGLGEDVRRFGLGPRLASMAMLIADELLSNALYNAPRDDQRNQTRADERRHEPRKLEGRERVELRYACDARYLAIEVTDHFGSLDREAILRHLAKSVDRGDTDKVRFHSAGAGMGIALSYSSCNHLVFNLHPGERTEAIALLDVRFKPAALGSRISSFNIFTQR
jgi:CheY-like chemotaxis protein/anti-sigma regulatory factor (Ser/Thr protein kinase)